MKETRSGGSPSRRKILKSIAAGSGAVVATRYIPGQWSEPIVDSVVLPAHAQTSQVRYVPASGTVTGGLGAAPRRNGSRLARLLDTVVPKAEAQVPTGASTYHVCVEPSADGSNADVRVYRLVPLVQGCDPGTVSEKWLYNAINVPVPGSSPLSLVGEVCGVEAPLFTKLLDGLGVIRSAHAAPAFVELSSVENGATGKLNFGSEMYFDLDPGSCSPPDCCTPQEAPSA